MVPHDFALPLAAMHSVETLTNGSSGTKVDKVAALRLFDSEEQ